MLLGQNYHTKNGLEGKKGKPLKPNWSHSKALTSVAWSSYRSGVFLLLLDGMQVSDPVGLDRYLGKTIRESAN